jgi:hypothetical protein
MQEYRIEQEILLQNAPEIIQQDLDTILINPDSIIYQDQIETTKPSIEDQLTRYRIGVPTESVPPPAMPRFSPYDQVPIGLDPIIDSPLIPLVPEPDRLRLGGPAGADCQGPLTKYSLIQRRIILGTNDRKKRDDFVANCYLSASQVPDRFNSLIPSIVLIGYGKGRFSHCTGTLLNPSTVLTAAHCFDASEVTADGQPDAEYCKSFWIETHDGFARKKITGFSGRGSGLNATDCPFRPALTPQLDDDIMLVRLESPVALFIGPSFVPTKAPALSAGKGLLIYGRAPNLTLQDQNAGRRTVLPLFSDACRLVMDPAQEAGRLLHQCLTVRAMSGAPIFAWDVAGDPVLIGVHQRGLVGFGLKDCADIFDWCDQTHKDFRILNAGQLLDQPLKRGTL